MRDVPHLSAPGFISIYADGTFNDVSSTITGGLVLRVRTSTPDYHGFRAVFAAGATSPSYSCRHGGSVPYSNGCYKAKFEVPPGKEFVDVNVQFSFFSDHWDDHTGDQTISCADDPTVCPSEEDLKGIKRIELMAEGWAGDVHIEVESIIAYATDSV